MATANKPPTFQITNVSVDEDCGAVIAPFATELSPGAANEQDQAMTWHFSFTNPGLFKRPPDLFVNGTAGMISFTPATDVFGSSLIVADLEDDGGMHTSSHHGSSLLVGGKMSTQTRFCGANWAFFFLTIFFYSRAVSITKCFPPFYLN